MEFYLLLESNLTEARKNLDWLGFDIETAYNVTEGLHQLLSIQEQRIGQLNRSVGFQVSYTLASVVENKFYSKRN